MSGFYPFESSHSIPLQRFFQLTFQSQSGLAHLSDKEVALHLCSFVTAEASNGMQGTKSKLLNALQLKRKELCWGNDKRQKLKSAAQDALGLQEAVFSTGKQAKSIHGRLAAARPEWASLLESLPKIQQCANQVVDAAEVKHKADALTSCRNQARLPQAAEGGEAARRKRPLEDAEQESRVARKWSELNYNRSALGSSAEHEPHQPTDSGQVPAKKCTWNSMRRGAGGPMADVSNHEGAGEDRPASEDDDVQVVQPGFQTARAKLVSDLRKKGQNFSSFGGQSNSSNQVGMAPRTGLARRPRGGGNALGSKGGSLGGGNVRNGFVPPFVQKAMDGPGDENEGPYSERVMNLLAGPDGELPEEITKLDPKMVEMVCNEIVDSSGAVKWDDIAGQDAAKRLVQELVVWPILNPHLFKGARAPPRGLLLFGPPGTGKTLIGKAIASNMEATFFSISASSLTSKWIGEGEKMVRALFAVAGCLQPSVIFIDEIDSILSARKSEGEHEASRRMKTEMLIQMEGCDPNSGSRRLLIIGATNRPEELDEAARRRLPKQLYIPLPCPAARRHMIMRQLGPGGSVRASLSEADLDKLVDKTQGYSGSDMRNLIQEACQGPVRDAVQKHGSALAQLSEEDLRAVTIKDFQMAAKVQKASVAPAEVERYEQYNEVHGARYIDASSTGNADDDDDW